LTLIDGTVFHCILAMAAGLDSMMGVQKDSKEMIKHLGNTYHYINRNLQQNDKPSDSTVAAVMSLAIHEDLLGQPKRNKVHIDALYRMVDMRGGVEAFESKTVLLHKICRYIRIIS
jgi:Fungal specific transcription factor domain